VETLLKPFCCVDEILPDKESWDLSETTSGCGSPRVGERSFGGGLSSRGKALLEQGAMRGGAKHGANLARPFTQGL
jgi:hypothetical protein